MSISPAATDSVVRHTSGSRAVTGTMGTLNAALPLVRAVVLAVVAIALIIIGLPAVLAIA
ncbi:hypothetical protein BH24CHL5_BH24CHL5_13670 [soil metagenome]